jgi:hypothetical protein
MHDNVVGGARDVFEAISVICLSPRDGYRPVGISGCDYFITLMRRSSNLPPCPSF